VKTILELLSLLAILCLASCSRSPDKQIVGRCLEVGTPGIVAFHEEGTVEVSDGQTELSGKFSLIAPGKLKLELIGKGGAALGPRI
jgi:hypothetical protein